ncbi:acyl-CoA dehydrogenase [Amycolatopsis sp. K13G38]|uniref:Acyl-CoA dehydrogenase n=2 Tax=Amycolatopsis acididurans TaxID=2724524 RepID=A0ABX1JE39_9PSEU|nr:acyl-CoA dehydrogenase [Amycolatopsis acididurans]
MPGFTKPVRVIFGPEHDAFRVSVRAMLAREAAPRAEKWLADGVIDRGFWKTAAAQGFVAFAAPAEYGGLGLADFRFNAILDEEIVYAGVGTDAFMMANDIVGPYLWDLANSEQRERWLPGVVSGDTVLAIAMSEPGAGSDLRGMRTVARRDGDHYVLDGSKTFITNGIQADLVIVAAQTHVGDRDRISLFVVEAGAPGFGRGRSLHKIGRHAQDTAELHFDGVRVPQENVLGEVGSGFGALMRNLPQERLAMAVTAIADAEHVLERTVDYAQQRRAFGQPIGSFQANRFAIAEMVTEVRIGRSYVDDCIMRHCAGQLTAAEAAGAKYWATELEWRVVDRCLQLHGGYGYMEEYEIARRWRDARVQRIYGGTTEIMKEIVGRSVGL